MMAWLSHSPIILENADRAFYRRFTRSLVGQAAPVERALTGGLKGEARLAAAIALTQIGLSVENASPLLRRAGRLLAAELARQILPDGGPISRNPRMLVELLLDLLPTRQAFAARSLAPPEQLLNAVDRMTPILRMFRHADGSLANFNGMSVSEPETLATLLAYGDPGAAILDAPYSGYQRLEGGSSIAIIDVGAPPPWEFSGESHAGCLSFEFSSSLYRIIVNCGAPPPDIIEARLAARATAAHSTLVVADRSSCRFAAPTGLEAFAMGAALQGPSVVEAKRSADGAWLRVDALHDGYVTSSGVVHHRTLALARDGAALYGEDRLTAGGKIAPQGETPVAARFHLHPDVRAEGRRRRGGDAADAIGPILALRSRRPHHRHRGEHFLRRARAAAPFEPVGRACDDCRRRADRVVADTGVKEGTKARRARDKRPSRRADQELFLQSQDRDGRFTASFRLGLKRATGRSDGPTLAAISDSSWRVTSRGSAAP